MIIQRIYKFIKKFLFKIFLIVLTICGVFFIFPILMIFVSPIYIFRWIIFKIQPFIRPDLGKMLSTRSTVYGVDDINTKPTANLCVVTFYKGVIPIDKLRKNIQDRVIDWRNEHGEITRPEMTQFVEPYLGFLFWKTDKNFDIKNHVFYYGSSANRENDPVDEDKMREIQKELLQKPHTKGRSPWVVAVIKNYKPKKRIELEEPPYDSEKSAIMVLAHHVLGDGYRLMAHSAEVTNRCIVPEDPKRPLWFKIMMPLYYMVMAPYEVIEQIVQGTDKNEWHNPYLKPSKGIQYGMTERITFAYLKEIKSIYKVTVTSLILASVTGGIRKYMLKHGIKVPHHLHVATALPMQGHPSTKDKLRNYMTVCFVKLPVGKTSARMRVKMINKNLAKYRMSTVPSTFFAIVPLIGGLTIPLVRKQSQNNMTTGILSNFPGPHCLTNFLDLPIIDMNFGSGLLSGKTGFIITALSYTGGIKILLEVDKSLIPNDKGVEEITSYAVEELDLLKHEEKV